MHKSLLVIGAIVPLLLAVNANSAQAWPEGGYGYGYHHWSGWYGGGGCFSCQHHPYYGYEHHYGQNQDQNQGQHANVNVYGNNNNVNVEQNQHQEQQSFSGPLDNQCWQGQSWGQCN